MKKLSFFKNWPQWKKIIYSLIFLISLFYLLLPAPPVPQLGQNFPFEKGFISQMMGEPVATFYTNQGQEEALSFFRKNYSFSPFLSFPLFTQRIDYFPQEANELINDMHGAKNTSFLVELRHPGRESLVIKGYGETKPEGMSQKDPGKIISFKPEDGKEYHLQLTLYQIKTPIAARIILLILVFLLTPIVFSWVRKTIKEIVRVLLKKQKSPDRKSRKLTLSKFKS
ncbi:hypothetical protein KBI33_01965 [Candidatus Shapirobacteria bacterium]|nr:hypothetical protein [Candidatus Shapirobacteria bacterium]